MYVVTVSVHVQPGREADFLAATLANARNTRKEAGNVRFDVLRADADACHFLLYECYHDRAGFQAHQQTPHYLEWKRTVADWMAQPRQAVKCHSAFFGDAEG